MLDQHSIVLYLHKNGLLPKERDNDLVVTLGPDAMAYCTARCYVHDAKGTDPKVASFRDMISHQFDESDQIILVALEVHQLCSFHVPPIFHV
jgi:hypothetical protein